MKTETKTDTKPDTDAPSAEPLLAVDSLYKTFRVGGFMSSRSVRAVRDASFTIRAGQAVAIVGESGSGKSTVLRVLSLLHRASSGVVRYRGRDISTIRSRADRLEYLSRVQMIFQDPFSSINPAHPIGFQLSRPLIIHGKAPARGPALEAALSALLESVALTPPEQYARKYPHQLSGGQRQRVAIARALAVEPELILADEPISMLDVSIRLGILNLMRRLRDERGIAFAYVTHDLASARYFADEIIVMYAGHIVEHGRSEAIVSDARHPYTRLLLSAVPNPERGLSTGSFEAKGEIPDLSTLGDGCPFAERCPRAMPRCREAMPPRSGFGGGHWARCYLYDGDASQ